MQGVGSPLTQMATLPALGTLGGSIFDAQMRLRELKLPPQSLTDTAADTLTSDRDELLKEIGRLTLQRSAVEKLHEITLQGLPGVRPARRRRSAGSSTPAASSPDRWVRRPRRSCRAGRACSPATRWPPWGPRRVTINVAPGMEWLKQFISVEVGRNNRTTARNAGRGLPGQGGGRLT